MKSHNSVFTHTKQSFLWTNRFCRTLEWQAEFSASFHIKCKRRACSLSGEWLFVGTFWRWLCYLSGLQMRHFCTCTLFSFFILFFFCFQRCSVFITPSSLFHSPNYFLSEVEFKSKSELCSPLLFLTIWAEQSYSLHQLTFNCPHFDLHFISKLLYYSNLKGELNKHSEHVNKKTNYNKDFRHFHVSFLFQMFDVH